MRHKVKTKIKTKEPWPGVPVDSIGYIIEVFDDAYYIAWDLENNPYPKHLPPFEIANMAAVDHSCPLRDMFSDEEFSEYLIII